MRILVLTQTYMHICPFLSCACLYNTSDAVAIRVALAARSKKLWKSFGCFRSSRPEALAMEGMTDLSRAIQASHVHVDTGFTGLPMVYKHHVYKIEYKYTVYIIYL